MEVRYEIRIRRSIEGEKYFWKLMKCSQFGEEITIVGYEDTLDLAYASAKKVYEVFSK